MDRLKFKPQDGYASQAVEISTYDASKRALLKSIYNEAIQAGQKIIMKEFELDEDQLICVMTFGIEANVYKSVMKAGIEANSIFENLFPVGYKLYGLLVESGWSTEQGINLYINISYGVQNGGTILPFILENRRCNGGFILELVNIPYTPLPVNIYSNNWLFGTSLNITFLFKKQ